MPTCEVRFEESRRLLKTKQINYRPTYAVFSSVKEHITK